MKLTKEQEKEAINSLINAGELKIARIGKIRLVRYKKPLYNLSTGTMIERNVIRGFLSLTRTLKNKL